MWVLCVIELAADPIPFSVLTDLDVDKILKDPLVPKSHPSSGRREGSAAKCTCC